MGSAHRLTHLLLPRISQLCCRSHSIRLLPFGPRAAASVAFAPVSPWQARPQLLLQLRSFTTTAARTVAPKEPMESEEEPEKKLTIYQRFKQTYKTHGKILIAVHLCTTVCWFGSFYALIRSGVDVIALLEAVNVSEKLLGPVRNSAWVDIALTYLLYKLFSPLRYAVTIGGTNMVVKQFRRTGRMPELREEDRLRNLAKESQASMKEIAKDQRENLSQQYKEQRANFSQRYKERRANFSQQYKEQRANFSQRYKERKENIRAAARRRLLRARSRRKGRRDSDKSP